MIILLLMNLTFLNPTSTWATPKTQPDLVLHARTLDLEIWRATVTLENKKSCVLHWVYPGKKLDRTEKLPADDCQTIQKLLPSARQDLLKPGKPQAVADLPNYDLESGGHQAPVAFQAPEECEIQPSGTLKCTQIQRTSAEQLVFQLLAIVERLNLDRK
ncbi:hypothetical protein WDW37_18855 [Bdellovibrionota bacterium FG-1]